MTPGRLLYLLWHLPLAEIARCRREGGLRNQWLDVQGHRAMRRAAGNLPPLSTDSSSAHEICFLTGQRYWHQTAFCFRSLQIAATDTPLRPVFVDDGTFDDALRDECLRVFPCAKIVGQAEINTRLEAALPASKFPSLRKQRLSYFHLRKLTDVHAGLSGWRLVLDSDMLFFRRPDALLAWLETPTAPIHMRDVANSYGYPAESIRQLTGLPIPELLNVGVCGLCSDAIDWHKLEYYCTQLLARHGTSYYLEQALVAMLMAETENICLLPEDYRLMPDEAECQNPTATLHHYVDLSKRGYYRQTWRYSI